MTAIFRDSQWQDGMEINHGDLSAIARFVRSQVFDTMAWLAGEDEDADIVSLSHLFAVGNGGRPGAISGLQIGSSGGPICQRIASVDGSDAAFLVFYLANELSTTFAAADPTNPRIDIVCVKLDYADDVSVARHFKDAVSGALTSSTAYPARAVRITKQVIQGTPGATPTIPVVPAGFVPWAGVYIGAGMTTLPAENVWDWRVPVGLQVRDIPGASWGRQLTPSGAWSSATFGGLYGDLYSDGAAARNADLQFPFGNTCRILKIGFLANNLGGATLKLQRADLLTGTVVDLIDYSATLGADFSGFAYSQDGTAGPTKKPIWTNGYPCGHVSPEYGPMHKAQLHYVSNAASINTIRTCRLVVAGR